MPKPGTSPTTSQKLKSIAIHVAFLKIFIFYDVFCQITDKYGIPGGTSERL